MKGDFLGFSFDGIHSSQLGITHVSSSDRYDEDLFPEVRDKTIEIPNNHGEYYYGSTYGTRTFEINIAYDSITEKQFRDIRRLFGTRKVCELIFDERPYKVYYAKIESPIEMSYVCFDEQKRSLGTPSNSGVRIVERTPIIDEETGEETGYEITREQITPWVYEYDEGGRPIKQRIYKGEGTISLICYQPFAHQLFKIKELYEEVGSRAGNTFTKYDNVDEWIDSSGILTRQEWNQFHIDQVVELSTTTSSEITITIPALEEDEESGTYTYKLAYRPIGEITIEGTDNYTIDGVTIVFNKTNESVEVTISYNHDNADLPYSYAIPVYNPGDLNVGFALYIPFVGGEILPKDGKSDIIINGDTEILVLTPIKRKNSADTGILIDTRTHLIEGVSFSQVANTNDYRKPAWEKTGTLYNEHIKIGEFPYIKRNDWKLDDSINRPQAIYISCGSEHKNISIYYDYLYF